MTDGLVAAQRALAVSLAAGALTAFGDAGVLVLTAHGSFLSGHELQTALAASVTSSVALALVVTLLFALGLRLSRGADARSTRRRATLGAFAVATVAADVGLWLLTTGRRAHAMPLRPLVVAVAAFALGAAAAGVVRASLRVRDEGPGRARRALALALGALSPATTAVSALVLPRSYPAFHVALAVLAVVLATIAADLALPRDWDARPRRVALVALAAVGAALALTSPVTLLALRRTPNARYVTEERAPIVGRLVAVVRRLTPVPVPRPTRVAAPSHARPEDGGSAAPAGLVLTSQDVLLVTIDALRFDRLAALGGHGDTPEIDALAREGVLFRHAYTATPHTSYALSSILTGKLIRPVMELPDPPSDHVTLPELLRRYGVRTAAFYPPAIFFVDEARFTAFRARGFGFEYRKEMFAPAADRVGQLDTYLRGLDRTHPVFVWVHLFEPHEPYDPAPEFRRGDTAEERYDGEVRAADSAFGGLLRTFRAARPEGTVIVTADHGEEFGDHGGEYHGTTLYDEQARVPFVWSSPGVTPPHVVDAPVSTIDIAPTLLAALGIPKDARMRGDDLGPVLRDPTARGPEYAYASLGETWMVTDGTLKEICLEDEAECRLFDLATDPHEAVDVADEHVERAATMRRALSAMIGSIPRVEAVAMSNGIGWPEPLARAELGDPTAGPDVVPLLASDRADVRAAAARALAKLAYAPAAAALARLRTDDADPTVRAESAVAGLVLGDDAARPDVEALAHDADAGADALDRTRRAALGLARRSDAAGSAVLVALASDAAAPESSRVEAMHALGVLGERTAVPALVALLPDVRLRIPAAQALGVIGDRRAAAPLLAALTVERYVPARGEEARALAAIGERRAVPQIRRFLGVETPLPDGVLALVRLGDLARASGRGAMPAAAAAVRRGVWDCDLESCAPGVDARLALPTSGLPRGEARVVVRTVAAAGGGRLTIGDVARPLVAGTTETRFTVPDAAVLRDVAVHGTTGVRIVALAVVPPSAEIPPPPPEPWQDGGVAPDAGGAPR